MSAAALVDGADVARLVQYPLFQVSGVTVTPAGVLSAVVALLLAWLASVLVRRVIRRYGDRHPNANQASLYTVSRLAHYTVLIVGVLLALDMTGIPVGKFAVFAGALGVGLGFGLQAIFSNFVSGLILLFDRSLKVGDFVELGADLRGTVRAINIRATLITTNDNIDVIVPNAEFVSGRVVNWTHRSVNRRIRVPFGVAYGVDKELVKKAALEAAEHVPFTLTGDDTRKPQVWLVNFGDNAVEFMLAVWLTEEAARRNAAIKAAYLWELDSALKRYGIEIPFPQRDLHVRSLFGLDGAQAFAALRGEAATALAASGTVSAPEVVLSAAERAALAKNDAQGDAEREIAQDIEVDAAASGDDPDTPPSASR
ncbi:Mechanosensitive ion channel protein MscS [Luteimonas sp. 9C]|uniref:mechanosensitive ion channel family protein n=1 Tax=Luteimonas sp. 9C TaxID=2653148 RepID=UPI0012F2CEF0|nr:mechanosensitive ion channel domain-containing protein [Luteimonas sp. 9C]VXB21414.1 Mechanosensitive ion channel protein MscS [Luteimonas sp. 9C]